jgi:hypothetical protein
MTTNLFLIITLLTNSNVIRITTTNTIPGHLYEIQRVHNLTQTNSWDASLMYHTDTNYCDLYDHADTNHTFYRVVDYGVF